MGLAESSRIAPRDEAPRKETEDPRADPDGRTACTLRWSAGSAPLSHCWWPRCCWHRGASSPTSGLAPGSRLAAREPLVRRSLRGPNPQMGVLPHARRVSSNSCHEKRPAAGPCHACRQPRSKGGLSSRLSQAGFAHLMIGQPRWREGRGKQWAAYGASRRAHVGTSLDCLRVKRNKSTRLRGMPRSPP